MTEDGKIIVALDAMGGDYAPAEQVKGAVEAVNICDDIVVRLYGDEQKLRSELSKYKYDESGIIIVPSFSVVENCDVPTNAIRQKKDSSMVLGMYALKNGEADAFVSCGNTGAILVGGQTIVGRMRGVDRAGLAFLVPTARTPVLIMDCGANIDCRPEMLVQFAKMGSIYMKYVLGVSDPKVGLVNIGEEETKGNHQVQETFPLLKECGDINFVGSVESRGMIDGEVDVAVCDGFVGNTILKTYEGVAANMLNVVKSALTSTLLSKAGALLIKNNFKKTMKQFSVEEYGGAPMLGLRNFVVKTHGNSKSPEIRNTVLQCRTAVREGLTEKIAESLSRQ
ncbi:MAG: phosphate acyltransferase PlsX [Parasporobacterium sp.]|nr:phosphate acyltransferase PlsX [Parasporobacterium sp.]